MVQDHRHRLLSALGLKRGDSAGLVWAEPCWYVSVREVATLLAHKLFDSPVLELVQVWWQPLTPAQSSARLVPFNSSSLAEL